MVVFQQRIVSVRTWLYRGIFDLTSLNLGRVAICFWTLWFISIGIFKAVSLAQNDIEML